MMVLVQLFLILNYQLIYCYLLTRFSWKFYLLSGDHRRVQTFDAESINMVHTKGANRALNPPL